MGGQIFRREFRVRGRTGGGGANPQGRFGYSGAGGDSRGPLHGHLPQGTPAGAADMMCLQPGVTVWKDGGGCGEEVGCEVGLENFGGGELVVGLC